MREMVDQTVQSSTIDGVTTITLNRPEVLNALNLPMSQTLARMIQSCKHDDNVRTLLLTGAGRGFCAGGDMKAAWEYHQAGGDLRHFFRDLTVPLHRAITDIRLMEKPVIAAISGVAGGGGMSLAMACDFRLAGEDARLKQAYTSIGLVPDLGWTATVPQVIGGARTMELLLIDPVLDAKQALALGLVHEVVANDRLLDIARAMSARLSRAPTTAFGGAKALVNATLLPMLETQLERERQRLVTQAGTRDFLEGLEAFVQKRSPRFNGR
jgi:2-(1,2-epoxy-1,2-dihydrophenyl)acetyl-CoA isomerase